MTDDPSMPTATPNDIAEFAFRAFDAGDGAGLAAVTHPEALRSLHRRLIEVIAAGLWLRRQQRDLEHVSTGGAALSQIADADIVELRGERLGYIPGVSTFGELLSLDAAEFFDRTIRGQTEVLGPKPDEMPGDTDPISSFEVDRDVVIDGEWASVPYRRVDRYYSGHVRKKDNVLRARLDGTRWLLWSAPDLIVHWSLFLPPDL